jgi:DNA repair ATPase RecN
MKKILITTTLAMTMLVPFFASAEMTSTSTATSSPTIAINKNFTECQQAAIEKKETANGVARTAYNQTITNALSVRKDAEKAAVALTDATAKKAALKAALDTYKAAVKTAQETLTAARKANALTFETDTKACRAARTDARAKLESERKATAAKQKLERKTEREAEKKATSTPKTN